MSGQRQRNEGSSAVSTRNTTTQGADEPPRTNTALSNDMNPLVAKDWLRENEVLREEDEHLEEEKQITPTPAKLPSEKGSEHGAPQTKRDGSLTGERRGSERKRKPGKKLSSRKSVARQLEQTNEEHIDPLSNAADPNLAPSLKPSSFKGILAQRNRCA